MFEHRYERLKLLGEGSFGAAHLVRQRGGHDKLQVAKEIRISHLTAKQQEAALAESEVLKRLSHPNIIAYVDSFIDGRTLYIIMEYADGGDLASKILSRRDVLKCPFLESEIMFIHLQLALALTHVHGHKILHRDLKPLNVFLTQDGLVKLGDFGIAKVLESTTAGAQTTIGTPLYIAPEICNNETYGVKSDLWSLGVLTYELATLRVPFQATSLPALVMKVCSSQPEPLPPQYTKDLNDMVFALLAKDPCQRPGLQDLLRAPFARRHMCSLKQHSLQSGSGGCEALLRSAQELQAIAPAGARASGVAVHDCGRNAVKHGYAALPARDQSAARQDAFQAAARDEFLRNREIARRAKQRAESSDDCSFGANGGQRKQSRIRAASAEDHRERDIRRGSGNEYEEEVTAAMEMRRRGHQERAEKEAAHMRELEEARRQAHLDRQMVRQRQQSRDIEPDINQRERDIRRGSGKKDDEKEEEDVTPAMEIRRRGHQERAEKEAAHLRELEEARRQVHLDRQIVRQRQQSRDIELDIKRGSDENDTASAVQTRRRGEQERAETEAAHLRELEEARRQAHIDRQVARQRLLAERSAMTPENLAGSIQVPPNADGPLNLAVYVPFKDVAPDVTLLPQVEQASGNDVSSVVNAHLESPQPPSAPPVVAVVADTAANATDTLDLTLDPRSTSDLDATLDPRAQASSRDVARLQELLGVELEDPRSHAAAAPDVVLNGGQHVPATSSHEQSVGNSHLCQVALNTTETLDSLAYTSTVFSELRSSLPVVTVEKPSAAMEKDEASTTLLSPPTSPEKRQLQLSPGSQQPPLHSQRHEHHQHLKALAQTEVQQRQDSQPGQLQQQQLAASAGHVVASTVGRVRSPTLSSSTPTPSPLYTTGRAPQPAEEMRAASLLGYGGAMTSTMSTTSTQGEDRQGPIGENATQEQPLRSVAYESGRGCAELPLKSCLADPDLQSGVEATPGVVEVPAVDIIDNEYTARNMDADEADKSLQDPRSPKAVRSKSAKCCALM